MSILKKAIHLATTMHDGQFDKGGQPYILHPLRLMLKCETDEERVVALLHDIVEDTEITLSELRYLSDYSAEIVDAIDCLTRRESETYDDFIDRVKTNKLATKIKILDLDDNMDISRLNEVTDKDQERMNKYAAAIQRLVR
ncbi:GTP pyrophosphokinase [Paenibacillus sp. GCM10027627]|uniref:GTP pyrophosphokinase n=1 Tax=unclassified Paenibacillus TaxID=185978 RepID=UPI00362709A7